MPRKSHQLAVVDDVLDHFVGQPEPPLQQGHVRQALDADRLATTRPVLGSAGSISACSRAQARTRFTSAKNFTSRVTRLFCANS